MIIVLIRLRSVCGVSSESTLTVACGVKEKCNPRVHNHRKNLMSYEIYTSYELSYEIMILPDKFHRKLHRKIALSGFGMVPITDHDEVDSFSGNHRTLLQKFKSFQHQCSHNRRFRNNCEIVEEPNSSSKNRIRVKFFSLLTQLLVF